MSKRKKAVKRHRKPTVALLPRKLEEGDMVWLADEYRRRSESDPSLTPEAFADEYSVPSDDLRLYLPELNSDNMGRYVVVWHGTSCARARAILSEGFKPKTKKGETRRIFFTKRINVARGYARSRSNNEADSPAVIMCTIDLNEYDDFERRGDGVFAFKADCISSQVVRNVIGLERRAIKRAERQRKSDSSLTDVALTFNSSRTGIAFWINSYLKLDDDHRLNEEHEAVGQIKEWLDKHVEMGRFGEVPDDEMLEQVRKHLPEMIVLETSAI